MECQPGSFIDPGAPIAVWGFLAGFVCWPACFRLIIPISSWLIPIKKLAVVAVAVCRVLTAVFLVLATSAVLSLAPVFFCARPAGEVIVWRSESCQSALDIVFIASLAGLCLWGVLFFFFRPDHSKDGDCIATRSMRNSDKNIGVNKYTRIA